jgi:AraC-like DNA-binding protein
MGDTKDKGFPDGSGRQAMSKPLAVYHGPFGRVALYELDRPMTMHAHREGHLIFHLQGPEASIRICDAVHPLTRDCAAAVNPWQPHNYQHAPGAGGALFLVLYIKPAWFLQAGRSAKAALRFGRNRVEITDQIDRLVFHVASLLMEDMPSPLFSGYLYELTHECFDQSWQWVPDAAPVWPSDICIRDYRVRNSIRFMARQLADGIVLDDIARDSGMSRPHFYKLFRQHVGLTPNVYANTLRVEAAIGRLTSTSDAVTTIGLDLGFASQASFTRFFISNVGIAPTDYRRTAQCAA